LTWNVPIFDGGFPIFNYKIYKGTLPGYITYHTEVGNQLYYNDTNVTNGLTYYYQVSAVNALGEGPLSNEVSATPQEISISFTGRIHYVGGIGPGNYTRIQAAIDAANGSDTVFVFDDSAPYYENIVINKSINLIGENKETTIINGRGKGSVTKIFANKVNITGFTITNSGRNWWSFENQDCGIVIDGVQKCTIINNIISSKHYYGIGIQSSFNNSIMNNRVTSSYAAGGIALYSASYNNIVNNNLILSKGSGISITYFSNHNNIANNNVTSKYSGIYLQQTIKNNIKNNNLTNGGISIGGYDPSYYNSHNISTDNIVNEKPVYYYKNSKGITINGIPIGQLILANCTDINLKNLHIIDTNIGITIAYSTYFNITNNNISSNSARNIDIISSSNINIIGNSILNAYQSIQLYLSSKNNIIDNNISLNSFSGIEVHTSFDNNIIGNKFLNNRFGIYLYSSWNNNVLNNIVSNNYRGFFIVESSNNNIIFNNISENREYGIYIEESSNNILNIENITYISRSVNNKIYHNNFIPFIRYQACDKTNSNFWNATYPTGGNYWSDYDGTDQFSGPNQDQPGSDGIGDTPYIIDDDSQDNYPLMESMEINIEDTKNIKITLDLTKPEYYVGETIAGFINITNDNPFDIALNDLPWQLMVGIFFNITVLDDYTYLDAVYNRDPIEVSAQSTLTIAFELYEMNTLPPGGSGSVYLHLPVGNYTIFSYFYYGSSTDYAILESNRVNFKIIEESSGIGDGDGTDGGGSSTAKFYQTIIFASATGLILIIVIFSIFVTATEVGKYKFFATFVAPFYSRELKRRKNRYKDGYLRGKVHGYILGNPGESYNTIKKNLKLNNGALAYHLKVLEREREVRSERDGLYKRFYPFEGKITDEILELSKLQKRLVNLIKRKPGQTQKQLADRLKVPTQKINYHVKILEEARVLRLEREANKTRCYMVEEIS
ncbi:MAG: right-handed parallel beta-helix repeat-containing protein, partial [Thermoplasmata archaeon]|nr:right-handed parallel beta-helix repeat-containing protein [Thermoplasmata archaeon]